jgi:hypothetical protein
MIGVFWGVFMLNVIKADSTGVEDGKLILRFLDENQKRYDMAVSGSAVAELLAAILRESKNLAQIDLNTVQLPEVPAGFRPAIGPNMTPAMILSFGAVELAVQMPERIRADLRACVDQAETAANPGGLAN